MDNMPSNSFKEWLEQEGERYSEIYSGDYIPTPMLGAILKDAYEHNHSNRDNI